MPCVRVPKRRVQQCDANLYGEDGCEIIGGRWLQDIYHYTGSDVQASVPALVQPATLNPDYAM